MYVPVTYGIYFIFSLAITIWVGASLFRNGRVFLLEAFQSDKGLAEAVSHLLLLSFYLINFGFIALFLRFGSKPNNWIESIEYISTKLGVVLIVSGAVHFFNMWIFAKLRKKSGPGVRIQSKPIREPKRANK